MKPKMTKKKQSVSEDSFAALKFHYFYIYRVINKIIWSMLLKVWDVDWRPSAKYMLNPENCT